MNWLMSLFSSGDGVKVVGDTLTSLFTNDDAREKALEMQKAQQAYDLEMAKIEQSLITAQTDINKIEAANPSIFVSGWRPFVGWVCAVALLYVAILEPLIRFVAKVIFGYQGEFPVIDTTITMQVLLGMLGLSGMRSFDKFKGTDTKAVGNAK
jgi:Holin of 3TMs, for gene-transfer release